MLERVREGELEDGRYGLWGNVTLPGPSVASHVERLFGFVVEERFRCKRQGCTAGVCCRYERHFVWRIWRVEQ